MLCSNTNSVRQLCKCWHDQDVTMTKCYESSRICTESVHTVSMYDGCSPCQLVVLLEYLAEGCVVHDSKVLQQQQVFVQLNTCSHEPFVRVALYYHVRQQQLAPALSHTCSPH
eukprot:9447-Heterococcus_DN1.PRE.2